MRPTRSSSRWRASGWRRAWPSSRLQQNQADCARQEQRLEGCRKQLTACRTERSGALAKVAKLEEWKRKLLALQEMNESPMRRFEFTNGGWQPSGSRIHLIF